MIASSALVLSAAIFGGSGAMQRRYVYTCALTVLLGLGYTILSERYHTVLRSDWAYAERMPKIPVVGTGLAPLLQWVLLPTAALYFARRSLLPGGNGVVRIKELVEHSEAREAEP